MKKLNNGGIENPLKVIAVLQTTLDGRLLQVSTNQRNQPAYQKREVILSMYIKEVEHE